MKVFAIVSGLACSLLTGGLLAWQSSSSQLGSVFGCEQYDGRPEGWPADPHAGMVPVAGGAFRPGVEGGYLDERPFGEVQVGDFWIDRTEVTRAQFSDFVEATGYVTEAERSGSGAVFQLSVDPAITSTPVSWWRIVAGADWRNPNGPASAAVLGNQPVTLVTLADAQAYAAWRGNELPNETQWEYAARAGAASQRLGEEPVDADGRPTANYWQGLFPMQDAGEDGFAGIAPVGCFPSNAYGVFDMIGNVWEWTSDAQWGPLISHANGDPGRLRASNASTPYVIKGGSYLCASSYCARYRTAARERQEADLATSHVGFRTIRRATSEQ